MDEEKTTDQTMAQTGKQEQPAPETAKTPEPDPIEKLTEERDLYLDQFQRTLAEFDNFRKRTAKEKASMYDDGVAAAVTALLPVVDNLERALASQTEESSLKTGVELTYKHMMEILAGLEVKPIPTVGEKFDPNLHSAVMHEEDPEAAENTIVAELQTGYTYKDKVIRYSMVKVAN